VRDDLLSPADVRRLLDTHGLAPRRAAGQNFVGDPNTVRSIVADARIGPDDTVLEIGPGLGSLTVALARVARRVVAVEIDAGLASAVREVCEDLVGDDGMVEVHHADAMQVDLDVLVGGPARLVANLPYNVATPLVVHALSGRHVRDAYVMVQREVGERWAAEPGDGLYAGISVKLQLTADVEVTRRISRNVFTPVPNVDSVMVRLTRRPDAPVGAERDAVHEVVEAAFAQRRRDRPGPARRAARPGHVPPARSRAAPHVTCWTGPTGADVGGRRAGAYDGPAPRGESGADTGRSG
jgi:16S rRNA (adenine1518-N6/adenine1519-N6)-dimethyltransferase